MNFKNNNPIRLSVGAAAIAMVVGLTFVTSCKEDKPSTPALQNVLQIAIANNDFDVLEAAAVRAGTSVTNVLSGTTAITVFAPTDAAFVTYLNVANEAAAITAVNALTPTAVADLLTFHVIAGSKINAANIAQATTRVTTARSANNFAFVTKTSGGAVTINNARVTTADVDASNGVIHIIDAVLTPPVGNIVQVATSEANAANFNILASALTKAELITAVTGAGPLTVFAPTDAAFLTLLRSRAFFDNADLTEAQVLTYISTVTASSTPLSLTLLTEVLRYHVVSAAGYSINLTNNQVLTTLKAAAPNTITVGLGTSVTIDGSASEPSTVNPANISATNGVVHVIDRVLLP
jgi:uncharacterized surface protein with fasciclin (FAS1) repeats